MSKVWVTEGIITLMSKYKNQIKGTASLVWVSIRFDLPAGWSDQPGVNYKTNEHIKL